MNVGPALRYFFTHACINIYQGDAVINLLDFFPLLKQGQCAVDTILHLLHSYVYVNNLFHGYDIISDKLFNKAFNGDIPAQFYYYCSPNQPNQPKRILMKDAIESGILSSPLTTFQLCKLRDPDHFDSQRFNKAFLKVIIEINIYDTSCPNSYDIEYELAGQLRFLLYKCGLLNYSLINIKFKDIIKVANEYPFLTFLEQLSKDMWLRLLCEIIDGDVKSILKSLDHTDPRSNSNGAYHLACESGNQKIVDIIRDDIVRRNWYEQQVFDQNFMLLIGNDNPARDIHLYSRREF